MSQMSDRAWAGGMPTVPKRAAVAACPRCSGVPRSGGVVGQKHLERMRTKIGHVRGTDLFEDGVRTVETSAANVSA
jgi:hypothetical protein